MLDRTKRHAKKILRFLALPILATMLACCGSVYLGSEVPTLTPRDLEHVKGESSVNLVVICEEPSAWEPPSPLCDDLKRTTRQALLESGVFTDFSTAENVPRLEIASSIRPLTSLARRLATVSLWLCSVGMLGGTTTTEHVLSATFIPPGGSPVRKEYHQTLSFQIGWLALSGPPPNSENCSVPGAPADVRMKACGDNLLKNLLWNLARDLERDGVVPAASAPKPVVAPKPSAGAEQR
jgi:hypothetical protein